MTERIKKLIVSFLLKRKKERWHNNDRPKVLIESNRYYTRRFWQEKIDAFLIREKSLAFDVVHAGNKLDFLRHLPDADYVFTFGFGKYTDLQGNRLKMVFFAMSGLDGIHREGIQEHVRQHSAQGIASRAIAEYALAFATLMLNRYDRAVVLSKRKKWRQDPLLAQKRLFLCDQIVGVLGVGNNGREIARVFGPCAKAVYGCDRNADRSLKHIDKWFSELEINAFVSSVDILVIAVPLTGQTRHLIDDSLLTHARSNLIIINTSRGQIIDESALIAALRSGRIGAAVLDTTIREPLSRFSKLWKQENILITPHISGNINLFKDEIADRFLSLLVREVDG
jgi:phosphoglycerate dehydrogenase-like enzyme